MTCSPTGMPVCLRASSRQSSAARSCAKHDHERNVMGCSQTLKNDTLTHSSLWADHSFRSHDLIADYCNEAFYARTLHVVTVTERLNIPRGAQPGIYWTPVAGRLEPGP